MAKRPASSKATRGASKGKKPSSSGASNPKTNKFRSQYNSLAVIAKGGPSKKSQNTEALKKAAKDAADRRKLLDDLSSINMLGNVEESAKAPGEGKKKSKNKKTLDDNKSQVSGGSRLTTASFASVWSNCSNASLNEFFHVWNPKLETHKDALAVIAGLSQIITSQKTDHTDSEYTKLLFKIISSPETPSNVLTGALLAITFVIRKLPAVEINENFDQFYSILKDIMDKHHETKKKTLIKCLIKCFASLSKAHPLGKEAIERPLRKKINIAIRQLKVQDKIKL